MSRRGALSRRQPVARVVSAAKLEGAENHKKTIVDCGFVLSPKECFWQGLNALENEDEHQKKPISLCNGESISHNSFWRGDKTTSCGFSAPHTPPIQKEACAMASARSSTEESAHALTVVNVTEPLQVPLPLQFFAALLPLSEPC